MPSMPQLMRLTEGELVETLRASGVSEPALREISDHPWNGEGDERDHRAAQLRRALKVATTAAIDVVVSGEYDALV